MLALERTHWSQLYRLPFSFFLFFPAAVFAPFGFLSLVFELRKQDTEILIDGYITMNTIGNTIEILPLSPFQM